jgi:outer membrane receptor protein involved in Fe transport
LPSNLSASWTGFKNLTLQAGDLNLFNTEPPHLDQTLRRQARAHDDRFDTSLGRRAQLPVRDEFNLFPATGEPCGLAF